VLEDVFQDVFRNLVEKDQLSKLRDVKHLRKFLSVVACHAAIDRMKSLSRRERASVSTEAPLFSKNGDASAFVSDTLAGTSAGPDEAAQNRESDAIVAGVLGTLAPRERAFVEMHYMDGRTHREISEILGVPQDTVSTVLRRTRDKLKDELLKKGLTG
jgi:RNA polymerase sigma factor (sigma-70 family)